MAVASATFFFLASSALPEVSKRIEPMHEIVEALANVALWRSNPTHHFQSRFELLALRSRLPIFHTSKPQVMGPVQLRELRLGLLELYGKLLGAHLRKAFISSASGTKAITPTPLSGIASHGP